MALKPPQLEDYGTWDMDTFAAVPDEVNGGNFDPLGRLSHWICADGRVALCNNARGAAILRDAQLTVSGVDLDPEVEALFRKDFANCVPPFVVAGLLNWQRLAGAELCQVLHEVQGPTLQPWNIAFLSMEGELTNPTWRVRTTPEQKTKIYTGSGNLWNDDTPILFGEDWLFLGREIDPRPWHELGAGWNVLGPLRIAGVNALVWWLNNAMHCSISPIKVGTEGMSPSDRKEFLADLEDLGQTMYIETPFGAILERLKSEPTDFKSPMELLRETCRLMSEFLIGSSTAIRLDSGGAYNAIETIVNEVSGPLLSLELSKLAYSLNRLWVPLWKDFRKVPIETEIRLGWNVLSMKDKMALAEMLERLSNAAATWPGAADTVKMLIKTTFGVQV